MKRLLFKLKKIFVGILIIAILAGAGKYLYDLIVSNELSRAYRAANVADCDKLITPLAKDYCYAAIGILNGDLFSCDQINVRDDSLRGKKDLCYRSVAFIRQDFRFAGE